MGNGNLGTDFRRTAEHRRNQKISTTFRPWKLPRNGFHGWQCWYVLTTLITSITSLNICETKTRQKMKLFWNCCMLHLLLLCSLHISVWCWWRRHLELSWADLNNLHRSKQNQASFLGHIRITVITSCSGFKVAGFSTEYSWAVDRMCFMKMTVRDTQRCWKQLASKTTKAKRNDKKCILVELFKTQSVPYQGAIETTNQDTIGVVNLKRLQCTINVLENLVHDRWLCCRPYRSYHLISLAAFASLPCLGCDCPFSILIEANLVIIFLFTANFTSNNLNKCKKQTNQAIIQCDLYNIWFF